VCVCGKISQKPNMEQLSNVFFPEALWTETVLLHTSVVAPRPVYVGFVMDKLALGQVFLWVIRFLMSI
jgi:hypothetical protein